MSRFGRKGRGSRYKQLRDAPHLENTTMRSLTVTLTGAAMAAALLTGCGTESGPTEVGPTAPAPGLAADNTPIHTSFTDQLEEVVINPCNGETILLTGSAHGEANTVGGGLHVETHYVFQETGIGQTTGARYILRDVFHEGFNSPSGPAVNFTFTFRETYHFNSSEPGQSFTGVAAVHYVQPATGDGRFTKDVFVDFACRG
jgi:hypothetical protein